MTIGWVTRSRNMDVGTYDTRGIQRYPVTTRRYCSIGVISFNQTEWTEHVVRVVDISIIGIGIEAGQRIAPGLVWFKERVGGFRSGVLLWSKQDGPRFRGGIKFISLSREEEESLLEQNERSLFPGQFFETREDSGRIIAALIETVRRDFDGMK